jgi:hypothetical protein
MNNKEFISYSQCQTLAELNYDGDYDYVYHATGELWERGKKEKKERFVPAPLKQQVLRWFREKYSLLPNIWSGKINHIFYGYDILHIKKQKFVINNTDLGGGDCDYDTYEEAENATIDKLIELAKQQDNDEK